MAPDDLSRRDFLLVSAATLTTVVHAPRLVLPWRRAYDLVIRGGTVFDGLGGPGIEADVAIAGGKIVALGQKLADTGATEIDARGLAVAPGFIDIHSHGDGTLWTDPRSESVIRQGITTIVVGQDGSSRAPIERTAGAASDDDPRHAFPSMAELWAALAQLKPSVNVASMVGLGTLRAVVIGGDDRPATADEIARMARMVEQALADGACGASSGLEYTPGAFAARDELIALCRPLAARKLPYATHMRNEDDHVLDAVDEAIAVAKGAGCPLQISHLKTEGPRNWNKLGEIFARIDAARPAPAPPPTPLAKKRPTKRGAARGARATHAPAAAPAPAPRAGIDITFDRYPYIAYQTGLSNLFPVWARAGSTQQFLTRITAPGTEEKIRQETEAKVALIGGWDNVMISGVTNVADMGAEGQRLGTFAKQNQMTPYSLAAALLERGKGDVGMVGFAMSEDNLQKILASPLGMVCSDGGAFAVDGPTHTGHPHPRSFGSFPRVLGTYVREKKALTLAQAIHKMSGYPASRIGLADRGRLAPGAAADVVIFDPAKVEDRATFAKPFQYPVGITAVIVNGVVALRDGQRSSDHSGAPLRL